MQNENRRQFLKKSAVAAGASVLAAPAIAKSRNSANDRVRVAVCGLQGRGESHVQALHELAGENVELAAMCDCHDKYLNQFADAYEKLSGHKVARYGDMRAMLDDESIDAVTFATPNHWHALGTIWSCQAKKDVYVEKPGTQNIAEGRQVIAAARKYNRIVQHGTQCRSSENIQEGIAKLKAGAIGDLYMARVVNYKVRGNLGKSVPSRVPDGLNWDMWIGPGPYERFSNFNWRRYNWRFDFGCGDLGNQGVHQLDIVRWGLDLKTHPTKIQSMGGTFLHDDDTELPTTQLVSYEFADRDILVSCETRGGFTNPEAGMGSEYPFVDHRSVVGVIFYGSDGYMIFPDYSSYFTFLGRNRQPGPSKTVEDNPMVNTGHFRNWIGAVRSRNRGELNAEIVQGHYSSTLCHLGNIAYRTGRTLQFDARTERFIDDEQANVLVARRSRREPYVLPEVV